MIKNIVLRESALADLRTAYSKKLNIGDNINMFAQDLADKNNINFHTAKVITLLLITGNYNKVNISNSRIELFISPVMVDVLNAKSHISNYLLGEKVFTTDLKNYIGNLYQYL